MTTKKHISTLKKVTRKAFDPFADMRSVEDVLQGRQKPFDFQYLELDDRRDYTRYKIVANFNIYPRTKRIKGYLDKYDPVYGSNYGTIKEQFENISFEQIPYLLAFLRVDPERFLAEVPYGIEKKEFLRLFSRLAKGFVPSHDKEVIVTTPVIRNGKKVDGKQIQMIANREEDDPMYSFLSKTSLHSARAVISCPDYFIFGNECSATKEALDRTIMMREVNKQLEDILEKRSRR
jgi:hypothetical protein